MLTLTTLRLGFIVAAGVAGLALVYYVFDAIGDQREAQVRAEWAEATAKAKDDARKQADAAEDARLPAALPGSLKRLREAWCRDCTEAR